MSGGSRRSEAAGGGTAVRGPPRAASSERRPRVTSWRLSLPRPALVVACCTCGARGDGSVLSEVVGSERSSPSDDGQDVPLLWHGRRSTPPQSPPASATPVATATVGVGELLRLSPPARTSRDVDDVTGGSADRYFMLASHMRIRSSDSASSAGLSNSSLSCCKPIICVEWGKSTEQSPVYDWLP